MRRTDETPRRPGQKEQDPVRKFAIQSHQAHQATSQNAAPEEALSPRDLVPSKTRRKAAMHALQDLGEAMVRLTPARLAALALPEKLADAIAEARHITRWEARRRQMQFIGRLMRDIDPLPIQARLEQWAGAPNAEKARLANAERWRTRLLSEADALDRLCAEIASADRPRLEALVTRVRDERAHGQPPHAYRELFRTLNALFAAA
jgi:ribosome-associated protein